MFSETKIIKNGRYEESQEGRKVQKVCSETIRNQLA